MYIEININDYEFFFTKEENVTGEDTQQYQKGEKYIKFFILLLNIYS